MPLIPTVLWADRSDKLFLTLDVQDAQAPNVKLDNNEESKTGKLSFSATAGAEKQEYALELELNKEIDVSASQISISPRHIFLVIVKTEKGYWPRLTKEPSRNLTHIKVDWDKWVDEDEEGTGKDKVDLSQFNLNSFEGMGGMGGLGGDDDEDGMGGFAPPGDDDEDDSDNDELPDLVQ